MVAPLIQDNVKEPVKELYRDLLFFFPELTHFYGYAGTPDHNNKRCLDAMVYDSSKKYQPNNLPYAKRIALGNRVIAFLKKNAAHYGINGFIWNRHVYGFPHSGGQQSYRGPYGEAREYKITAHDDHVHIEIDGRTFAPLRNVPTVTMYVTEKVNGYEPSPSSKVKVTRDPGYQITGTVGTRSDGKYLVTVNNTWYPMDSLSDKKPEVVVPDPNPGEEEPKFLPPYVVSASDGAWEIDVVDGSLVVKRDEGYVIRDGVRFETLGNGEWLIRDNDRRLQLSRLSVESELPEQPDSLPPYVVSNPKGAWVIRISDGALLVKLSEGDRITNGIEIAELPNGQWLETDTGTRIHMPNLEPEDVVVPPKTQGKTS